MNNVLHTVSHYYGTSHVTNFYCGIISVEATISGVIHLVKGIDHLARGILMPHGSTTLSHYREASEHFNELGKDLVYASVFGFGAINPAAGIIIPVVAVMGDIISEESGDGLSDRYVSSYFLDWIPKRILAGASLQFSSLAGVSFRIGTVTVGALVAVGTSYALGVSLAAPFRHIPVNLTFG